MNRLLKRNSPQACATVVVNKHNYTHNNVKALKANYSLNLLQNYHNYIFRHNDCQHYSILSTDNDFTRDITCFTYVYKLCACLLL